MATDGSSSGRAPIVLEYSMTARPHRPVWLTVLRAAGVAVSFVVGAVGGYGVALAITMLFISIARIHNGEWQQSHQALVMIDEGILVAGVLGGAFAGGVWALHLCRKYPQWTRH